MSVLWQPYSRDNRRSSISRAASSRTSLLERGSAHGGNVPLRDSVLTAEILLSSYAPPVCRYLFRIGQIRHARKLGANPRGTHSPPGEASGVALILLTAATGPAAPCTATGTGTTACTATPAAAAATTTSAASAKRRIRLRVDDEPIEEHVDGARHNFDSVERGVVEGVSRSLDQGQRRRYLGGMQLIEEVDARGHRHRCVGRAMNEDCRREVRSDVCRRRRSLDRFCALISRQGSRKQVPGRGRERIHANAGLHLRTDAGVSAAAFQLGHAIRAGSQQREQSAR